MAKVNDGVAQPPAVRQDVEQAAQDAALALREAVSMLPDSERQAHAITQVRLAFARAEWKQMQAESAAIANSGVFGVRQPEEVMGIGLVGKDLGLSLAQAMRSVHIIKGRPTLAAELMRALVLKSGKGRFVIQWNADQTRCTVTGFRAGDIGSPETEFAFSFGAAEAKAAGYAGKDNYRNHPREMYLARASGMVCRTLFPDITMNIYAREEAQDIIEVPVVRAGAESGPPAEMSFRKQLQDSGAERDAQAAPEEQAPPAPEPEADPPAPTEAEPQVAAGEAVQSKEDIQKAHIEKMRTARDNEGEVPGTEGIEL